MGAIELQDVSVVHDGRTVLEHVDLHVHDGEVVALLGSSGAGKTSLLRAVAGSDAVAHGRVVIGGRDVTRLPSRERELGMVAQGAPLQPTRDVEGNLRLPLDLRGDDRAASRERSRGEALRFGLTRLLRRRPHQLSTGERTVVATARSVVRAPAALLLDEPATHLDHRTRAAVLQQVGIVQRTRGTTMLVATNDVAVASALADRVAVLDRRRVAQVGRLGEVRDAPATLDVADLVSSAPLARLSGRIVVGGSDVRVRLRTAAGTLSTWHRAVRAAPGDVLLGIGPRDATLATPGEATMVGTITRRATTGARELVTVTTAAGGLTLDVEPGASRSLRVGAQVGVAVHRAVVARTTGEVIAVLSWP